MYCSHCGTENENTAKFCRQCGNALQANAQSNSVPSAFEQEISASKGRQSVANFLRAFQAHVAPQAKNYSVLNAQCSQMEMLERQRADFEKGVKSPVLLILGIVLIALGIGLILMAMVVRYGAQLEHRNGAKQFAEGNKADQGAV